MIPLWLQHVIGTGGALLVLLAYFLVSTGRVSSSSISFQMINLGGAGLLTTYALVLQGWSLVFLNGVWAIIALVALVRIFRNRSRQQETSPTVAG
jgi:hypothetical protein